MFNFTHRSRFLVIIFFIAFCTTQVAQAQRPQGAKERLCDTSFEDCRTPLLNLLKAETQGIDIGYWLMLDGGLAAEVVRRHNAGVPVRVLADPRSSEGGNAFSLELTNIFRDAGIPIRIKEDGGNLHWKAVILAGQRIVEFSAANFSPDNFRPDEAYKRYNDEVIYFSDDSSVVNSFQTAFDDRWTNTNSYGNYANITGTPTRRYPVSTIDPELTFSDNTSPEGEAYFRRLLPLLSQETQAIDVNMFRILNNRPADELIAAHQRGVPVRMLSDVEEYRNVTRYLHAYNLDRLFAAGIPILVPAHQGQNHEKSVMLYSQGLTIFGSQNWAGNLMQEHNYFTTKEWFFEWFVQHFNRKWNNVNPLGVVEYKQFVPLAPGTPANKSPANGASLQTTNVTLQWEGGAFAHKFDVLFGTDRNNLQPAITNARYPSANDPNSPVLATGSAAGNSPESYILFSLTPNTTYYWQIVGKTMADKTAKGSVWSFTTGNSSPRPRRRKVITRSRSRA